MQTLYAVQFMVSPSTVGLSIKTEQLLREKVTASIARWYKDKHNLDLSIGAGCNLTPLQSHHISTLVSSTIDDAASHWTLNWKYDSTPGKTWHVSPTVARVGQEIEVSLVVAFQSALPFDGFRHRPRIVPDLINNFECWVNNRKASTEPVSIELENVEDFVSTTLQSPERTQPVVVISPVESNGKPLVDSSEIALWLAGIADVFVLANIGTVFELKDQIGDRLACYNGAVRVYRPRFTKRSKPEEHPVYLSSNVALFREAGKELRRRLFDECASISAARFTPGRITRAAREAIRAEEIESVITTRNEALRYLEDNNEFSALLKLADKQYAELKTERDDLELENSALREELASAREENANLKANLQSIWLAQVPESFDGVDIHTDEMDFGSVIDAVSIAEERFRETLVFLKSARTSAEDSSYNDSKRVFHAFAVMDLICRRRREALGRDEKLGRLEDLFSKEGLRYSPHISERTKGHWKEEYEVFYEGRRVPAHDHIKLGNHRNPEYCLRIYFFRDDDKYKFVIAHVGEHKTNTQT